MTSPTARTLAMLRRSGYAADVVERWIPMAQAAGDDRPGIKRDFLGFADVLGVRRGVTGVLAVQATTKAHIPDRLRRVKSRAELRTWLAAGNAFEVWGWHRLAGRWHVHRVAVAAEELRDVLIEGRRKRSRRPRQRELFA